MSKVIDYTGLDDLKAKLDKHRPLPEAVVTNLREQLVLQWTYNSNAIEGNTLTLKETKVVLEGITIGGKSLREHFEAINHRDAIEYVEALSANKEAFNERNIKGLHQLILKNVDDDNAGRYRNINVTISGAQHTPPSALQLPAQMEELIHNYSDSQQLHAIERAAKVHIEFVKIHPFVDGNGRTSRLLMNLELMKSGFPAVIVPIEDRLAYYEALDTAHCHGDYTLFLTLLIKWVKTSFEPYFWALGLEDNDNFVS